MNSRLATEFPLPDPDLEARIQAYAKVSGILVDKSIPFLGRGNDGLVRKSAVDTAVKAFYRRDVYFKEFTCYLRLRDRGISQILGFRIPVLVRNNNELLVIEMQIVKPPFLLDFGKVWLDKRPDYSPEVWADTHAAWKEQFGPERYRKMCQVLDRLRELGIYYTDPNPGNIMFGDEHDPY